MRFRPEADIWPVMSDDELKDLAQDINREGQRNPIHLYDGDILDGRNRWLAITKFCASGVEPKFEDVTARAVSPIHWVISLNEKRRHLDKGQREIAAAKSLPFYEREAKQRMANAAAAAAAERERDEKGQLISRGGSIAPALESPRRAADDAAIAFGTSTGGVRRAKYVLDNGSKKLVKAVEDGQLSLGKAEQIAKTYQDKRTQDSRVSMVAKSKMATRVKGLTGEVEWYTPRKYLDAAVRVMGGIDLDPASSDTAQDHVQASRYFTVEDDGLSRQWSGRVWLNPPYAMPFVEQFVQKMVASYEDGGIEGILLTNNATDTKWFHMAARTCSAICFTLGRIHFLEASNGELTEKNSPTHGQAFFYFGRNTARFYQVFSEFGTVLASAAEEVRSAIA